MASTQNWKKATMYIAKKIKYHSHLILSFLWSLMQQMSFSDINPMYISKSQKLQSNFILIIGMFHSYEISKYFINVYMFVAIIFLLNEFAL